MCILGSKPAELHRAVVEHRCSQALTRLRNMNVSSQKCCSRLFNRSPDAASSGWADRLSVLWELLSPAQPAASTFQTQSLTGCLDSGECGSTPQPFLLLREYRGFPSCSFSISEPGCLWLCRLGGKTELHYPEENGHADRPGAQVLADGCCSDRRQQMWLLFNCPVPRHKTNGHRA